MFYASDILCRYTENLWFALHTYIHIALIDFHYLPSSKYRKCSLSRLSFVLKISCKKVDSGISKNYLLLHDEQRTLQHKYANRIFWKQSRADVNTRRFSLQASAMHSFIWISLGEEEKEGGEREPVIQTVSCNDRRVATITLIVFASR